jgi:hypothetical protein
MEQTEKKCTKCGNGFSPTNEFFSKNKSTPDGFERWCKVCKKKAQAGFRLKKALDQDKPAAKKRREKSIKNLVPVVRKPQADLPVHGTQTGQITGASPTEIISALRKGMAAEIVSMIQEKFGL